MRKFTRLAPVLSLVALFAISCNKNQETEIIYPSFDTLIKLRVEGVDGQSKYCLYERFKGEFDSISFFDPNGCLLSDTCFTYENETGLALEFDDNIRGTGPQRKIDMMVKTNRGKNTYRFVRDLVVQRDTLVSGDAHTLIYEGYYSIFGRIEENLFFDGVVGNANIINHTMFYYFEDDYNIRVFGEAVNCDLESDEQIMYAPCMLQGNWSSYSEAIRLPFECGEKMIIVRLNENTTGKDRIVRISHGATFRERLEITQESR